MTSAAHLQCSVQPSSPLPLPPHLLCKIKLKGILAILIALASLRMWCAVIVNLLGNGPFTIGLTCYWSLIFHPAFTVAGFDGLTKAQVLMYRCVLTVILTLKTREPTSRNVYHGTWKAHYTWCEAQNFNCCQYVMGRIFTLMWRCR